MSHQRRMRWRVRPHSQTDADAIASAIGCAPAVARLLAIRGMTTPEAAHDYLAPSFDQLADPFLLPDAEQAAERLRQALSRREKVAIHGDYDGDGVTSAALWYRLLERLGFDVTVHVPHRKRDGYDMRSEFVERAKANGSRLIVTTDCGIRRCEEVEQAREAGIDVIITDHHEPGDEIPRAVAVINPHRKDSVYPFRHLAGVGVAFRAGEALVRHLGMTVDSYRRAYGDLAAIGTITDVVSLLGENRVLVKFGLESLNNTKKPGLKALIASSRLRAGAVTTRDVGFGIGPRLNAAGRVDESRLALDILLAREDTQAIELAAQIERANSERRVEQERVFSEAMALAAEQAIMEPRCLVVSGTGWNSGVIGLVANKLVERFNRPVVMIAVDEQTGSARGSARSIPAFHLYDAMVACSELLIEFGGHSHAAGFSIDPSAVEPFREAMWAIAADRLTEEDLVPTLEADLEVALDDVTLDLVRAFSQFEPFGCDNPEPAFISRNCRVKDAQIMGKESQHLKLKIERRTGPIDGLLWNRADIAKHIHPGDSLDLCYRPEINHFNGCLTVQLNIQDIRPAGEHG